MCILFNSHHGRGRKAERPPSEGVPWTKKPPPAPAWKKLLPVKVRISSIQVVKCFLLGSKPPVGMKWFQWVDSTIRHVEDQIIAAFWIYSSRGGFWDDWVPTFHTWHCHCGSVRCHSFWDPAPKPRPLHIFFAPKTAGRRWKKNVFFFGILAKKTFLSILFQTKQLHTSLTSCDKWHCVSCLCFSVSIFQALGPKKGLISIPQSRHI